MSVRIRFRSDNWHYADMRAKGSVTEPFESWGLTQAQYDAIEPAKPGDIWRSRWHAENGQGPIAGYAICCPKCGSVHPWTTATNCSFQLTQHSYTDDKGQQKTYNTCGHSGTGSCWDWTGSAEDGTLSANPSLLCHTCGYHGWLRNGELTEC